MRKRDVPQVPEMACGFPMMESKVLATARFFEAGVVRVCATHHYLQFVHKNGTGEIINHLHSLIIHILTFMSHHKNHQCTWSHISQMDDYCVFGGLQFKWLKKGDHLGHGNEIATSEIGIVDYCGVQFLYI
jgi:hypothetical protein